MTIHHRLNLSADLVGPIERPQRVPFPQNPPENGRIVISDVSEDDSLWSGVAVLLEEYHRAWTTHQGNVDIVARFGSAADPLANIAHAKFSDRDRKAAAYLALDASVIGFPQPQNILQFYQATYQTVCSDCRRKGRAYTNPPTISGLVTISYFIPLIHLSLSNFIASDPSSLHRHISRSPVSGLETMVSKT